MNAIENCLNCELDGQCYECYILSGDEQRDIESHKRGEIETTKDFMGETYFRIYTGCKHLDDFYTTNTLKHAEKISLELLN